MLPAKNHLRNLPTLTEVVNPNELTNVESVWGAESAVNDVDVEAAQEQLVHHVLQSLKPMVDARIQELVNTLLSEKLPELQAQVQLEVAVMVRRATTSYQTAGMGLDCEGLCMKTQQVSAASGLLCDEDSKSGVSC